MSRSASGALLAWTDKGGLTSSERVDVLRIAMRLAGYEPRCSSLKAAEHDALVEALLPERLRPTRKDRQLSLERCVSVMLGGMVPEDKVLTLLVNKTDARGNQTANAWQARVWRWGARGECFEAPGAVFGNSHPRPWCRPRAVAEQEHVTSRAVRQEYYISEAVLAREEIRAWARDPARQQTVLAVTGVAPDPVAAAGEALPQQDDACDCDQDGGVDTPAPSAAHSAGWAAPASAPATAPAPAAAPKVATTLGAPPPPKFADKKPAAQGASAKGKAKAAPTPAAAVLPPAPVLSGGIRVRIEVNDEMFTVAPCDLAALGLDPAALAAWYARKAGRPVSSTAGGGATASPSAIKLMAARTAVTGGEEAGSPRRGVKRLSDAMAAMAGPSAGSPESEEENMPPPGGRGPAMEPAPAAKKAAPWPGAAAPGPAQPQPLPALLPEHERAFTQMLLSLTGHRGECSVPDLVRALAGSMGSPVVANCLQVFEANNKLMVADQMVFIT
jgi:hypothetical protein